MMMYMISITAIFLMFVSFFSTYAQKTKIPKSVIDTTSGENRAPAFSDKVQTIDTIAIEAVRLPQDRSWLEATKGTYLYAGKKTEVITIKDKEAAITEKYGRQIFAKIPGVFVYDMDGTGNQVNIATRGLDPHRGWEFNIRKDGIITNSDMYGYPASHYNIPMEAVERIELVRGTGSLQYGAQFGGMLNYISKQPDTTTSLFFESINTVGSYGLVSTYSGASGKIGAIRYSAWMNKKWLGGYRNNADSEYGAEAVTLFYDISPAMTLKAEWTHSNYLIHLAGPLTDSMFAVNPQMATRSRNYYNPDIHVPSLSLLWNIAPQTTVHCTLSGIIGDRNSVMFDRPATIADTIVASTLQFNNRQVDIDRFNSYTAEIRLLQKYSLFAADHTLTAGMQYLNNDLHRRQQGKGTTGSDFDLTLVSPVWGRDLHFTTQNIAIFIENRWMITERFSLNTGIRFETGQSEMTGIISYYSPSELPTTIERSFPLIGINALYSLTDAITFYGGYSRAYRPVILKDIIPASVFEFSDKNLRDADGFNAEIGFRGHNDFLQWDISGFYLRYNNRLGILAQTANDGTLTLLRTNIGNAVTAGLEVFLQADFVLNSDMLFSVFTSTSYMDAYYSDAKIRSGNTNISLDGNAVESVPAWISRNGCTLRYSHFSLSLLSNYTAESFADPLNNVIPNQSGSVGLVPAYHIMDMSIGWKISKNIKILCNVNNMFDTHYFTKRPQFYPGPGIWPSDGRTISSTIAITP